MIVYTYSETRKKLASLLEHAVKEREVGIKRKDGQIFVIRAERKGGSPLDVKGLELDVTAGEIVQFIHEGRRTSSRFVPSYRQGALGLGVDIRKKFFTLGSNEESLIHTWAYACTPKCCV